MFKEVDPTQEAAILAAETTTRGRRGPDLTIRTNTQWFKLTSKMGTCEVENHADNVDPEQADPNDRERPVYKIDGVNVCRWCYIAGGP